MSAVVACGLGNQADKLAEEYLRLAEQNASAVVVSQTWGEVHRVNSRVRDALKAKGLLGANDTTVQVLDRLDLTSAQKRRTVLSARCGDCLQPKGARGRTGVEGKVVGHLEIERAGRSRRKVRHCFKQ